MSAVDEIFDRTVERFQRPLVSYARSITGDLESARDAVQETFLRLAKQDLKSLEPRLPAWLFFVCRNCALDHTRKVVRLVPQAEPDLTLSDDSPSPDERAVINEDTARLRDLVALLPERQRELIALKFDAGFSYREIADLLSMSISNVGFQLHSAVTTLRNGWHSTPSHPGKPQ